ncbi:flavin-containing monooxygenase [Agromyces sp. GXS1127]|uniref:flavin-containing monooxygenase n=1 Tax=Agromyces sp. GXS1127 TaxID=3424181 RepID=UPI003D319CAC
MDAAGTPRRAADATVNGIEEHDTVVVGGGQAGLTIGHLLMTRGRDVVILDAHERIGDAWRRRWDSLRLNTPAKYDGLPGLPIGDDGLAFPTKDEFADYLERYAAVDGLPVVTRARVIGLDPSEDRYLLTTDGGRRFAAPNVVIATGPYQVPRRPPFADRLASDIVSLHSDEYRDPGRLAPGRVLVVGFGNSAAEIALDVSRTHRTWISGRPSGQPPTGGARGITTAPSTGLPACTCSGSTCCTRRVRERWSASAGTRAESHGGSSRPRPSCQAMPAPRLPRRTRRRDGVTAPRRGPA